MAQDIKFVKKVCVRTGLTRWLGFDKVLPNRSKLLEEKNAMGKRLGLKENLFLK